MFGYVRADAPYLFLKDDTLYKAMYCGLCKGISSVCGQSARMGLSYDITFLSVLLHNLKGVDVNIKKGHCLTHCIRSKQMADVDEMTKQLGALNTILAYYKYTDDIQDGDGGKAKRLLFKSGFKRAKKAYPKIEEIVKRHLTEQSRVEKSKCDSAERAADATGNMLAEISALILEEKRTEITDKLFYSIGKWIYLIDALDDYDKDKQKGAYNPFVLGYQAECKADLLKGKSGEEVQFIFHSIFYDIRECLSSAEFCFNRDLVDNILLRGLPQTTKQVMTKTACRNCKTRE